jgi:hypothetical protein
MRFVFLLISDLDAWAALPRAEEERVVARQGAYERALRAEGRFVACDALRPPRDAKTVHIRRDGSRLVTDGPFAETKEALGGYYVVECASMDEAVEWATRVPKPFGAIEVRPIDAMT